MSTNNTAFTRSKEQAFVKSSCQARNFGGYPSQYSIVHAMIPVFGMGSYSSATLSGTPAELFTTNNDDWPNVYSTLTENWADTNGFNGTKTTTYTQYLDAGGPGPIVAYTGTFNPNQADGGYTSVSHTSNTVNAAYITDSMNTGNYTAVLSNKWFGAASLAAFWASMATQALAMLADVGVIPLSIVSATLTNPGSGYSSFPRDYLVAQGGTPFISGLVAGFNVTNVSGSGAITTFSGSYYPYASPPSPLFGNSPTGGHGSGAAFNITMGPGNLINTVYPISVSPFWQINGSTLDPEIILACAHGFPLRLWTGGIGDSEYPFAASIQDAPTPYNLGSSHGQALQPNSGWFLSSQSIWQLTGQTPAAPSGLAGKHTTLYGQQLTIRGGSFVLASPTAVNPLGLAVGGGTTNPVPITSLLTFTPADVGTNYGGGAGYGIIGFQPTAA